MRIAFVGKGGSGKSTLAASFTSYLSKNTDKPVVVFDADINVHIPGLLGFETLSVEKHLSTPVVEKEVKKWLVGDNEMKDLAMFRKTTPPTRQSNILRLNTLGQTPLQTFVVQKDSLSVFAVGTYQEEGIGASCYHNSLAIFESLLNHTDDKDGYVVVDMVAGVDAFAGTLHAQFDMTCLVVEPTRRSVEVYKKYKALATEAGVLKGLVVIANKVRTDADLSFIQEHVEEDVLVGCFFEDEHIRYIDQTGEAISSGSLTVENQTLLGAIAEKLDNMPDERDLRLQKMWKLHKKYVSQAFIKERFGDLTNQIDLEFSYRQVEP